jgi:hypothetical protein
LIAYFSWTEQLQELEEGFIEIDLFSLAQKLQSELHSFTSEMLLAPTSCDSFSEELLSAF